MMLNSHLKTTSLDSSDKIYSQDKDRLLAEQDAKKSEIEMELSLATEFDDQCLHGLVDPLCSLMVAYARDCMDYQLVEAITQ